MGVLPRQLSVPAGLSARYGAGGFRPDGRLSAADRAGRPDRRPDRRAVLVRYDRYHAARLARRAGLLVAHLQARLETKLEAESAARCAAGPVCRQLELDAPRPGHGGQHQHDDVVQPLFVDLRLKDLPNLTVFVDDLRGVLMGLESEFRVLDFYPIGFGVQNHIVHLLNFVVQMGIDILYLRSACFAFPKVLVCLADCFLRKHCLIQILVLFQLVRL